MFYKQSNPKKKKKKKVTNIIKMNKKAAKEQGRTIEGEQVNMFSIAPVFGAI